MVECLTHNPMAEGLNPATAPEPDVVKLFLYVIYEFS